MEVQVLSRAMKYFLLSAIVATTSLLADTGHVIDHNALKTFSNNGNSLIGLATEGMGAKEFEIWRTSIAPGSCTPPHMHECEETFIFLKGKGRIQIGDEEIFFEAPCTVITPANIPHQYFNTGDEPTDAIVVLGIGSEIVDKNENTMNLPWRK